MEGLERGGYGVKWRAIFITAVKGYLLNGGLEYFTLPGR
jgi:hypothetical protein